MRTVRSRTYRTAGPPRSLDELDRLVEQQTSQGGPPDLRRTSFAARRRSLLVLDRVAGDYVVTREGVAEVPVYGKDAAGSYGVLFRLEVEVLIDEERQHVRRGRQTIIPNTDGPEPTATLIQRRANLGEAWKRAVQIATFADDPKAAAARAARAQRLTKAAAEQRIARDVTLAGRAAGDGARQINRDVMKALSRHRGQRVSRDVVQRRKRQAGVATD